MARELTRCQLAERSIIKKYRHELWEPFIAAVKRYELLSEGDRVAVCISGGKDSMLMAKLFQELHRHTDFPFEIAFLVMDPGYNTDNRKRIEENAALLEIPVNIFETNIFDVAYSTDRSPCYLCARMRRGNLYAKARELGCNKIALGHHLNDAIETVLIGMFHSSQMQTMLPKVRSANFEGMELIRPMYCIREKDIVRWAEYNKLSFLRCACRFTENIESGDGEKLSRRQETKDLINRLMKDDPDVEKSLFNALHSVNVDLFPGYEQDGIEHTFLEKY